MRNFYIKMKNLSVYLLKYNEFALFKQRKFYLFIKMRRTGAMDGSIIYYKHFLSEDSIN